jgi:hypothetical protein
MAEQLPETVFERMTADECAKERVERQKMLVAIPRRTVANALPGEPAEVQPAKVRVTQAGRGSLEKANRAVKISYVAAKEGGDAAPQRIFNPEPTYAGMMRRQRFWRRSGKRESRPRRKKLQEANFSGGSRSSHNMGRHRNEYIF